MDSEDDIMLKKFSVTNFKNFKDKVTIEFDKASNYEFNDNVIKDGCVTKGIVYGINGSGKSNLGLAIFDIIFSLTDKTKSFDKYIYYRNLDSPRKSVEFDYLFCFNGKEIEYLYEKTDVNTLKSEKLYIDGKEVLNYDFSTKEGYTTLKGAENLQFIPQLVMGIDTLSRVKYVRNNAILEDNEENKAFIEFVNFVDKMLMFYSLKENRYQGFTIGSDSYTSGIIREGRLKDFEEFLKERGINYNLISINANGIPEIFCQYKKEAVPFMSVASTGTMSLALFYYWYIQLEKASFVYIDEFDAFYHFELAQDIVEMVKKLENVQIILSTHNTDLISNDLLRPDAYYLIKNNVIKSFDKSTVKELRRAHNLQKMFKAGAFDE